MFKNKFLVVGGGPFQLPLIRKGQELGFEVYCVSSIPSDPGILLADKPHCISILDHISLEKLCLREKISCVATSASDLGSIAVGYLNSTFNLKGITSEQVLSVSDKARFAELQKEIGTTDLFSFEVASKKELHSLKAKIKSYPVIMKPLIASGSKGVRVCHCFADLLSFHDDVISASFIKNGYLIQQYMAGEEIGGECLVEQGSITFLCNTTKFKNNLHVPTGHLVPPAVGEEVRLLIRKKLSRIVSHLRIMNTAINFDTIISAAGKVEIIDLSLRSGGNLIPELLKCKYDIDLYDRIVKFAGNNEYQPLLIREKHGFYGSIIFGSQTRKIFTAQIKNRITGVLQNRCRVLDLIFDVVPGDPLDIFDQGNKRFGHALIECKSKDNYQEITAAINND